jgi:hypothetical protein
LVDKSVSTEPVETPAANQDVGPDVETSLGQQETEAKSPSEITEPNTEVHSAEHTNSSGNTAVNPPTDEDRRSPTRSLEENADVDEEQSVEMNTDVVDLDAEDSNFNQTVAHTSKGSSMAKRLRSST